MMVIYEKMNRTALLLEMRRKTIKKEVRMRLRWDKLGLFGVY